MSLSAPEDAFLDVNDAHLRVYGNVHADGLKLGQLEIVTTISTGVDDSVFASTHGVHHNLEHRSWDDQP